MQALLHEEVRDLIDLWLRTDGKAIPLSLPEPEGGRLEFGLRPMDVEPLRRHEGSTAELVDRTGAPVGRLEIEQVDARLNALRGHLAGGSGPRTP